MNCNAVLGPSFKNVFGLLQCRPNSCMGRLEGKQKFLVSEKNYIVATIMLLRQ